ncbi:RNA polymerase sigma factor [Tundrisphaera sp. TA3]|uniref:RNA polymerase sigma factor n=1 Tax=Tundrisphaera sp. TA3 TaxID=3435775 RepID=UPI003EB8BBE7
MIEGSIAGLMSDDILVERGRHGDRDALEELFRRHWTVAYRVASRLLGHEQDAQDATQDCMIKALSHLKDFDGRSGFRTWLLRIVTNASIDSGRRRKRRPLLGLGHKPDEASGEAEGGPLPMEPSCQHDPSSEMRRRDLREILDRALARLAPNQRQAFVLFAEGGLSYEEIAEVQDVPIGTVMSRLFYARSKLQKFMAGVDGL